MSNGKVIFINPGTAIVVHNVASIEMIPGGECIVFMVNGKAYSATKDQASEILHTLLDNEHEDYN